MTGLGFWDSEEGRLIRWRARYARTRRLLLEGEPLRHRSRRERRHRPTDFARGVAQLRQFRHGVLTGPVALDLDFHMTTEQPPQLYHLAKRYLDLLGAAPPDTPRGRVAERLTGVLGELATVIGGEAGCSAAVNDGILRGVKRGAVLAGGTIGSSRVHAASEPCLAQRSTPAPPRSVNRSCGCVNPVPCLAIRGADGRCRDRHWRFGLSSVPQHRELRRGLWPPRSSSVRRASSGNPSANAASRLPRSRPVSPAKLQDIAGRGITVILVQAVAARLFHER